MRSVSAPRPGSSARSPTRTAGTNSAAWPRNTPDRRPWSIPSRATASPTATDAEETWNGQLARTPVICYARPDPGRERQLSRTGITVAARLRPGVDDELGEINAAILSSIDAQCDRRLRERILQAAHPDTVEMMGYALDLATGPCSVSDIARQIERTERTLQRRCTHSGDPVPEKAAFTGAHLHRAATRRVEWPAVWCRGRRARVFGPVQLPQARARRLRTEPDRDRAAWRARVCGRHDSEVRGLTGYRGNEERALRQDPACAACCGHRCAGCAAPEPDASGGRRGRTRSGSRGGRYVTCAGGRDGRRVDDRHSIGDRSRLGDRALCLPPGVRLLRFHRAGVVPLPVDRRCRRRPRAQAGCDHGSAGAGPGLRGALRLEDGGAEHVAAYSRGSGLLPAREDPLDLRLRFRRGVALPGSRDRPGVGGRGCPQSGGSP